MPFHTPQPISKPPKCPPAPRPQPTQPQLPSPPHYNLTPTPPHPFFASLAARLAYTSEPRFLPNGELTRPDPMPSYIPVHSDDRLPPHPRPASLSSWNPVRRSERRREAKSDFTTSTMEGRVEKKKGREEARVGAGLRQMELALRPKREAGRGQRGHAGWHPCEHTAAAEREQQRVQGRESEGSNGNITTPRASGRVGKKGEKYVRCMCCGREYQAKSPAELKPDTKLSICGDCGRKMGVEHGETEEMEL